MVSKLDEEELFNYIHEKMKDSIGLKDKDIPLLTGYAFGSVKTIFQRVVTSWCNFV